MVGFLAQQNGGSEFAFDGRPTFDSPTVIEVLHLLREAIDSGVTAPLVPWTTPGYGPAINNDKLATQIAAGWMLAYWGSLLGTKPGEDTGLRFADSPSIKPNGSVVATAPMVVLFLVLQRHFIAGITEGAIT